MSVECGFVNTLPPRMFLFWMTCCSDTRVSFLYCAASARFLKRPRRSLRISWISPCSNA